MHLEYDTLWHSGKFLSSAGGQNVDAGVTGVREFLNQKLQKLSHYLNLSLETPEKLGTVAVNWSHSQVNLQTTWGTSRLLPGVTHRPPVLVQICSSIAQNIIPRSLQSRITVLEEHTLRLSITY